MYDDKQQVIEFSLTQHGKRMYARGELRPAYYSFSDEDIIYDSRYANFSESVSNSESRILDSTPRTAVIHNKHGVATNIKKIKQKNQGTSSVFTELYQDEVDRTYTGLNTLGTADINTDNAPAWQLQSWAGEVSASHTVITGSSNNIRIPQVNLRNAEYEISILQEVPEEIEEELGFVGISPAEAHYEGLFGQGTVTEVVPYEIFLEVQEFNTAFKNSNFDIEVFLVEEQDVKVSAFAPSTSGPQTVKKEVLTPLFFSNKPPDFGDIYREEDFQEDDIVVGDEEPDMVSYYFDIQVDDEIPQNVVCQYIPQERRRGIYGKYKGCEGPQSFVLDADLYDTEATFVDLEDKCDD